MASHDALIISVHAFAEMALAIFLVAYALDAWFGRRMKGDA